VPFKQAQIHGILTFSEELSSVCYAKFIGVMEQKNADTGQIQTEFIERHTRSKQVSNWNTVFNVAIPAGK